MHQLPSGLISFTQLAYYWHEARGFVLSSNSPELLQEPLFIPQLPLSYVPAPLLDAKPSCYALFSLTHANKYRMVNTSGALVATTEITAPVLLRAVSPGGLHKELLLVVAGAFKAPCSFPRLRSPPPLCTFHHTFFKETSVLFKSQCLLWVPQYLTDFLLLNKALNHFIPATISGSVWEVFGCDFWEHGLGGDTSGAGVIILKGFSKPADSVTSGYTVSDAFHHFSF